LIARSKSYFITNLSQLIDQDLEPDNGKLEI